MSGDHSAHRAAAIAALGVDAAALDRVPPPVQITGARAQVDAAGVAAPAPPHGGVAAGLRELRSLAGEVVGGVSSAFLGLRKPNVDTTPAAPPAPRVLPACLRVVKLTGGSETLGCPLRGVEHIVPAFVVPTGDLQVEHTQLSKSHELVPLDLERRLFAAHEHHAVTEPETDPEIVARLFDVLDRETVALRDYAKAYIVTWGDPTLSRLVAAILLWGVQELRLSPADAARGFERSWRAPVVVYDGRGRPIQDSGAVRATSMLLDYAKLDHAALVSMAAPFARDPFVYGGVAHASVAHAVEAERAARVTSVETATAREAFLNTMRVTTPKTAGLFVARHIVDPTRAPFEDRNAPSTEFRLGPHAYLLGQRRIPASLSMPRGLAVRIVNGVERGYEVLGDDDRAELSERAIEHGTRARVPRWVLENVMASARSRVASSSPLPIASFVDARDKSEIRKRMAVFRTYCAEIADSFTAGCDPYCAPLEILFAMHLAIVALRIDPSICANEVGKRQTGADIPSIVETGFEISRNPSTWIFRPDEAAP